jgi:hypothetical protein
MPSKPNKPRRYAPLGHCTALRRKLVTFQRLNIRTGALTNTDRTEWRTEPCNTPLFTPEAKTKGICDACAAGWTHPHNYPVLSRDAEEDLT